MTVSFKNKARSVYCRIKLILAKNVCVSLGENCLTENILQRHGKKLFSSPYSHVRSNIEYAIQLEADHYINMLDRSSLYYDKVGDLKVIRKKLPAVTENIYNKLHQKGFEFTHHDVLANNSHRKSFARKIQKTKLH